MKKLTKKLLTATSILFASGCLAAFPAHAMDSSGTPPTIECGSKIFDRLEQFENILKTFSEDCPGSKVVLETLQDIIARSSLELTAQKKIVQSRRQQNKNLRQKALAYKDIGGQQGLEMIDKIRALIGGNFALERQAINQIRHVLLQACDAQAAVENWFACQMRSDQTGAIQQISNLLAIQKDLSELKGHDQAESAQTDE